MSVRNSLRIAVIALLVLSALPAQGYVRSEDSLTGACLYWTRREIPWQLNEKGSADVDLASLQAALRRSFQAWQDVECSDMSFTQQGITARFDVGFEPAKSDNVNVIVWRERTCDVAAPLNDPCFKAKRGEQTCADIYDCWEHSAGVIALTTTNFNRNTGVIVDADIEFNGAPDALGNEFRFTATTSDGPPCARPGEGSCVATDVQNTATHEIGHFIGLDHSPVAEATMFASAPLGEAKKRSLAPDDMQGLCDIYPQGEPVRTCTPSGHITIAESPEQGCSSAGVGWEALAACLGAVGLGARRRNLLHR